MSENRDKNTHELSQITEVVIRDDGEEAVITCQGNTGEFDLRVLAPDLGGFVHHLMLVDRSMQIKRTVPAAAAKIPNFEFVEMPPIFFVRGFQCVIHPESGQLDLQLQPVNGPEMQVCLSGEHAKALFDTLLQFSRLPGDAPKPS